jgi:hypothetical protein
VREWLKRLPRLETLLRSSGLADASPADRTLFGNLQQLLQTCVGGPRSDSGHSRSPAALETIAVAVRLEPLPSP